MIVPLAPPAPLAIRPRAAPTPLARRTLLRHASSRSLDAPPSVAWPARGPACPCEGRNLAAGSTASQGRSLGRVHRSQMRRRPASRWAQPPAARPATVHRRTLLARRASSSAKVCATGCVGFESESVHAAQPRSLINAKRRKERSGGGRGRTAMYDSIDGGRMKHLLGCDRFGVSGG